MFSHRKVAEINSAKEAHEVLLRRESMDYGVKLAMTKAQMDATAAELEANREKLRKVPTPSASQSCLDNS